MSNYKTHYKKDRPRLEENTHITKERLITDINPNTGVTPEQLIAHCIFLSKNMIEARFLTPEQKQTAIHDAVTGLYNKMLNGQIAGKKHKDLTHEDFKSYLYRGLHNQFLTEIKRPLTMSNKITDNSLEIDHYQDKLFVDPISESEAQDDQQNKMNLLFDAIKKLAPEQREAIEKSLSKNPDETYNDIGLNKRALDSARQQLRIILKTKPVKKTIKIKKTSITITEKKELASELKAQGYSHSEIAEIMQTSYDSVTRYIGAPPKKIRITTTPAIRKPKPAEKRKIRNAEIKIQAEQLIAQGKTRTEVTKMLKCDYRTIIKLLGKRKPQTKPKRYEEIKLRASILESEGMKRLDIALQLKCKMSTLIKVLGKKQARIKQ